MTISEALLVKIGDVVSLGGKGGNFVVAGIEPYQSKLQFTLRSGTLNTTCDHTKILEIIREDK